MLSHKFIYKVQIPGENRCTVFCLVHLGVELVDSGEAQRADLDRVRKAGALAGLRFIQLIYNSGH